MEPAREVIPPSTEPALVMRALPMLRVLPSAATAIGRPEPESQ
jgi:hypothetical protein